jgi:glycogen debranching enzyme
VDRRGGILRVTGEIRRSVVYTTNAPILESTLEAEAPGLQKARLRIDARAGGAALLLNITPRLGFNRYLPEPQAVLDAAARAWHDWFASAPPVAEAYRSQYYYAWWIMRAGLISSRFYTTREAMTPSKLHYVGVWQWDAFFHAIAYRHIDRRLARDQIRILLDHQRADGMIPDAVHDEGTITHLTFPVDADVTKPPLIAWAAWKLYEIDGDREFLDEIYEPIVRWNSWWFERNDFDADGLCEYLHPFSSGLDDSPLWDEGMPVTAPDLNSYLFLQQEALGNIASVLGLEDVAAVWRGRAERMAERIVARLWDPGAGLFWPKRGEKSVLVATPFSLFPLLTGRLPGDIVERLVRHLTDKNEFWTRYPVPTVARDDSRYDPGQMWRGPTWVNVNYLLIEGLERSGRSDLASELRRRTLEMVMAHSDIYEYYHPETAAPGARAASIYGWSAALFIDLALQASAHA